MEEFEEIDKVEGSLILWKHREKNQFIIQICPALEKWILDICDEAGLRLSDYALPEDLEGLKKYTKSKSELKDEKLGRLFKDICNRIESPRIKKLRSWISLLRNKNYHVDINELKNGGRT